MLVVYGKAETAFCRQLERSLPRSVAVGLEVYTRLEDLIDRLARPRVNLTIAVLFIGSPGELQRLLTVRELLTDLRSVLVLAASDPPTIAAAHGLRPRFITFAGQCCGPLVAVVAKMVACQLDRLEELANPAKKGVPEVGGDLPEAVCPPDPGPKPCTIPSPPPVRPL